MVPNTITGVTVDTRRDARRPARDRPDASLAFYEQFAAMQVVHRRTDRKSGTSVAWISDLTGRS